MNKSKFKHHRRSIRLRDFDYSSVAAYFVTICVDKKKCLFRCVENEKLQLNLLGEKAKMFWLNIEQHNENIVLDEFVVMPNHIHGIIGITEPPGATTRIIIKKSLLKINGSKGMCS